MDQRLIILSDLWGANGVNWIDKYKNKLNHHFDIQIYDVCELADINISSLKENEIHRDFVNGGIEKAVNSLINLEKNKINILAFSIGGFIAWEACLKGLCINNFFAVSSTRLRIQKIKPVCYLQLYFGEKDIYKPNNLWFKALDVKPNIIKNKNHNLYKEDGFIDTLCIDLMKESNE